ncbi:hypothetical protein [Megamonas hypermegale]|uniref:hypothetical protein n=1 Tax=Megamonas hypermegale TaxID=158847 RepID=UPI0026EE4B36|nr:hypothetical protein [Megamonas hypermegale]
MLTKSFKSNKYYEVTRFYFKYGNEWDEMENTVTVWDTYEKAIAYIERYATGLKFASAQIEVINLDREITAEDYKKGNYNVVSFQEIYDVTLEGVEDTEPKEIIYMDEEKSDDADEQPTDEEQSTEPPTKYFAVEGYPAQFSNLRAAINFAKGIKVKRELVIYVVKQSQDAHMVNLEPVSTIEAYRPKITKANIVEQNNKVYVHIEDDEKICSIFFNTRHEAEHYLRAFLKIRDKPKAA